MKYFIHLPMKVKLIEGSETSAIRTQTPGNYPKEKKIHIERGESLKSSFILVFVNVFCGLNTLLIFSAFHRAYSHIFTYIHIYLHIFTYIYIYSHIFTYIYIYSHIFTYIYIYSHIFTYIHIYLHIFTYIHIYSHIFTYIYIYSHIFTYIHIYLHIFTNTCTLFK